MKTMTQEQRDNDEKTTGKQADRRWIPVIEPWTIFFYCTRCAKLVHHRTYYRDVTATSFRVVCTRCNLENPRIWHMT